MDKWDKYYRHIAIAIPQIHSQNYLASQVGKYYILLRAFPFEVDIGRFLFQDLGYEIE